RPSPSPAAPTRSSATSSASASWVCPPNRAPTSKPPSKTSWSAPSASQQLRLLIGPEYRRGTRVQSERKKGGRSGAGTARISTERRGRGKDGRRGRSPDPLRRRRRSAPRLPDLG